MRAAEPESSVFVRLIMIKVSFTGSFQASKVELTRSVRRERAISSNVGLRQRMVRIQRGTH